MNRSSIAALLTAITFTPPVYAYIGPGVGIGTIGIVIAVFAALILLVVGFVWYPLKRLMRRRKAADTQDEGQRS